MKEAEFYGAGYPYSPPIELTGKLIVLEGTDGVGRTTQIDLLRHWLEGEGYAVSDTGLKRSGLTQSGLKMAKSGHTLSPRTMSLFYAADFADRLERQIIPALKAGFVVLSDRYFYSIVSRDIVRGADPQWARKLYGFALKPDMVLYLRANMSKMLSRIVHGRGFDFWEAGMDIRCADNVYDSFCVYQARLTEQLDRFAEDLNFITIDANRSINTVFSDLQSNIQRLFKSV
ncbi:MAG: thymidylate kinase [Anaerolineaceae bacterium]|nr:thymidylate kinase [Anaerolineaceae bacterium]